MSQGRRQVQEGATSQKLDGVVRKWGPGGLRGCHFATCHLHDDQLASVLMLDEFSSSYSSLKEMVRLLLLSLSVQYSPRPPAAESSALPRVRAAATAPASSMRVKMRKIRPTSRRKLAGRREDGKLQTGSLGGLPGPHFLSTPSSF